MAPVIRISDEVFRRLQLLGEPLVDTPSSVIERLLDRYAASDSTAKTGNQEPRVIDVPVAPTISSGLFLAPASTENIKTTISRSVRLDQLEGRLDSETLSQLKVVLNGRLSFHCWAMTSSSRGSYDNMKAGDLVLFTPKGTGRFTYRGTVMGKIESQALGDLLWSVTPGRPWSLVYLLDDVRPVNLSKEQLVAELGYDRSFPVYGITRVNPERLKSAITRRGSLQAVLKAASS